MQDNKYFHSFSIRQCEPGEQICNTNKNSNYLLFCISGSFIYKSNLFHAYGRLYQGKVMFIPKKSEFIVTASEKSNLIIHSFCSTYGPSRNCILRKLYEHRDEINKQNISFCNQLTINGAIKCFLNNVTYYIQDGIGNKSLWNLKHRELFNILYSYYEEHELQSFFYPLINLNEPFKISIMNNMDKAHSVTELASLCDYGIVTFRRLFKKKFGMPAYQWMQEQKAEKIMTKLSMSYIPFADIIEEFKFNSSQELSRFCKKYLGDTPSNIRIKRQEQND